MAVHLDYINSADYVIGQVPLSGSAINGRDPARVATTYSIDYCPGSDFYTCDQAGSWLETGLGGAAGQAQMAFGSWDASAFPVGPYVLRLAVNSVHATSGKSQTFYDYYVVHIYDPNTDDDGDGLNNDVEVNSYGTNPTVTDTDGDGLSDAEEINQYGSNPINNDTDGDGIRDGWEVNHGLNLLDASDATADNDNDGLNNLAEFQNNADPHNADTDGDGLGDGVEVNTYGTSPTQIDSDNDDLGDYEEINQYATDPLNNDTDSDGMKDGYEATYGLDPLIDDASLDPDNDGLNNLAESVAKSDPHNPDTDADGLNDADEVNTYLTNPILYDTDGDHLGW